MARAPLPPIETSVESSARLARVRRRDTKPELALRRELHRRGLRFRVDRAVTANKRRRVDIAFGPARVGVFVDGCFWHGCPLHATQPRANADYWREKIARNIERDRETDAELAAAGWVAVRVWEHEDVEPAADHIEALVVARRGIGLTTR